MSVRRFDPAPSLLVEADAAGQPRRFVWRGRSERVVAIEATWEEADSWWRGSGGATMRRCYRAQTASGLCCLLYRRRDADAWTLGAILD